MRSSCSAIARSSRTCIRPARRRWRRSTSRCRQCVARAARNRAAVDGHLPVWISGAGSVPHLRPDEARRRDRHRRVRRRREVTARVCLLVVVIGCARAASRPGRRRPVDRQPRLRADNVTVRAFRVQSPLRIDGRLDEEVYRTIDPISDFIQQEPDEGQPATEKTEAWILFDEVNLYICARNWDSHPEREVANELRRDNGNILGNENLTFAIDTLSRSPQRLRLPDQRARRAARHGGHRRPAEPGVERHLARQDGALRERLDDGSGDPVQVAALSRQRPADVGHQPAAAREVEERVFVPVAGARRARHRRHQPHGLGGHRRRSRDARAIEEPGIEAVRGRLIDHRSHRRVAVRQPRRRPTRDSTSSTD